MTFSGTVPAAGNEELVVVLTWPEDTCEQGLCASGVSCSSDLNSKGCWEIADAILSHIYFFCVGVMMHKCALLCTRGSEDSWEPVLHFHHVGPGDGIKSAGWAASTLSYRAMSTTAGSVLKWESEEIHDRARGKATKSGLLGDCPVPESLTTGLCQGSHLNRCF